MGAPRITVVGSCNADLVAFVEQAPERGETVSGLRSTTGPGGKGANQAIAAARLGGAVSFVGAVGDDAMGAMLRDALVDAGVDVTPAAHCRAGDGLRPHRRRVGWREPDRGRAGRERPRDVVG